MIFDGLSNAFFLFLLRASGAELDGGEGVQTPPARRGWCRALARCGVTNSVIFQLRGTSDPYLCDRRSFHKINNAGARSYGRKYKSNVGANLYTI